MYEGVVGDGGEVVEEGAVVDDGVVVLEWEVPDGAEVEVEQSGDAEFGTTWRRYSGPDAGTVVTGLEEGVTYFRVREVGGEWSSPLAVEVAFVSRQKLYLLLGLGGLVVLSTVGAIVAGSVAARHREAEGGVG